MFTFICLPSSLSDIILESYIPRDPVDKVPGVLAVYFNFCKENWAAALKSLLLGIEMQRLYLKVIGWDSGRGCEGNNFLPDRCRLHLTSCSCWAASWSADATSHPIMSPVYNAASVAKHKALTLIMSVDCIHTCHFHHLQGLR